ARLDADAARTLLALPWDEVHLLALEPGDLHEEDAGRRLAAAVTGDGVEVKAYTGGQWTLAATRRGLLRVDPARLAAVNVHEGMAVFTLFDRQPVDRGERVAKAKVTPLAVGADTVSAAEPAGSGGRRRVRPGRARLRRARPARRAHGAARRPRASRQPPVPGALAGPARARHADVRDVLAGDDVRPRAPAAAGRRGPRQRGDRRP